MGKVVLPDEAERIARAYRAAGNRIVLTNGCFDLLHLGHVRFLESAGSLGDLLIVAVNSDRSVSGLKGPGRPIIPEGDRAALLAALHSVDIVFLFDGADAAGLIESIRPDVYVKGRDYLGRAIPETAAAERLGITVFHIPLVEGYSTSAIIGRILGLEDGKNGCDGENP